MFVAQRALGQGQSALQRLLSTVEVTLLLHHRTETGECQQDPLIVWLQAPLPNLQRSLEACACPAQITGRPEPATELEAKSRGSLVLAVRQRQPGHEVEVCDRRRSRDGVGPLARGASPFHRRLL